MRYVVAGDVAGMGQAVAGPWGATGSGWRRHAEGSEGADTAGRIDSAEGAAGRALAGVNLGRAYERAGFSQYRSGGMSVNEAVGRLKQQARRLKADTYALYLAYKDPRVPWYAKVVVACVVGYALSPIDLVPDFIPILGYLDDLVLVPLGIALALRLIPAEVMAECRERAQEAMGNGKPRNWVAAGVIIAVWALALVLTTIAVMRFLGR